MALYIFSDAHLGAHSAEKENTKKEKIAELCSLIKADGDHLVILGDLFDYWFEYKHAIPKEHFRVLLMLGELVERGIRIDYVSGNHDYWMDDFFEKQMKIKLHRDALNLEYDGKRIHLIHGDGLSSNDRSYRVLKRIFRNRFNIWWYKKLPPDWTFALARKVSQKSRKRSAKHDKSFLADYQAYAQNKLSAGFDIVVIGHLHIPLIEQTKDGTHINSGDFIDNYSYVKLKDKEISLNYLK